MSARRFVHEGQEWEAVYEGIGVGVGTGFVPKPDRWSYLFRCVSDPTQPEVRGHLPNQNPAALSEDDLERGLKRALAKRRR